jgi:hypothetical protein
MAGDDLACRKRGSNDIYLVQVGRAYTVAMANDMAGGNQYVAFPVGGGAIVEELIAVSF